MLLIWDISENGCSREDFFSKMHCVVVKYNLGPNIYRTAFNATVASFTKELHIKKRNYMLPFWLTKKFYQGFIALRKEKCLN